MAATTAKAKTNPYGRPLREMVEGSTPYRRWEAVGDMGSLAVQVAREAVVPPFGWMRDAIVQISLSFRRSALPLAISHGVYVVGYGVLLFGILIHNLGITEREAGAMYLIWGREIATWITAMVFTGVVGSAVAADLGARKIRAELDALAVLGVEQVKALVVPRVVACTLALPALALLSLMFVQVVNYGVGPAVLGYSHGVFRDNLAQNIVPTDLYFTMFLKNAIIGFFIGVVSCYKGLTAPSGAEGVGQAVKETVIISVFGLWLINSLFNLGYLTLFPDVANLRG